LYPAKNGQYIQFSFRQRSYGSYKGMGYIREFGEYILNGHVKSGRIRVGKEQKIFFPEDGQLDRGVPGIDYEVHIAKIAKWKKRRGFFSFFIGSS
jgi:hypothetical protein